MKNEISHTPTPWKVEDNRIVVTFFNESWNKQVPASKEEVVIGTMNACDDAAFIVRAVNCHEELLVNLRNAFYALKAMSDDDGTPLMHQIKKAITKAEGK